MEAPRIVVGIDGSEGSKAALEWAIREGSARGASVDVVICWSLGALSRLAGGGGLTSGEEAQTTLDRLLKEVGTLRAQVSTEIRPMVVQGHPARVLPEVAVEAQLLVVGSRGHGAFVGSVLGSVSLSVVGRAPCTVAVVPDAGQSHGRKENLAIHRRREADVSSEASHWQAMRGGV